mgnify:CR=1 FL=1
MEEKKTFREFKRFLQENCWSKADYGEGKYDRKIYNWFLTNKNSGGFGIYRWENTFFHSNRRRHNPLGKIRTKKKV